MNSNYLNYQQIVDSGSIANPYGTTSTNGIGLSCPEVVPTCTESPYQQIVPLYTLLRSVTKTWTIIGTVSNTNVDGKFNAIYARSANGDLFASDANSGQIWRFNVNTLTASRISTGPASDNADEPRCILNTAY
ncbi:hypothetical protein CLAFUR4_09926 [Fulvia fulva]|nr:hypothetical protein CLAFUR4_09926 [Fulvia fulva]WPV34223.1 hypothetical protein CLAFUW7_09923 [Fulvia fulva]